MWSELWGKYNEMERRAERAEAALREAREKALDEAIQLYRKTAYCEEYVDTCDGYIDALNALKELR